MVSSLYLLPLPGMSAVSQLSGIYTRGTPLVIPLDGGLCTGIVERNPAGHRPLTTDDLLARDATVGGLWADAALTMLAILGRLTSRHGTALRHRRWCAGVREIGVLGNPFPAGGLLAHPLLIKPTIRALRAPGDVVVTASGRLLALSDNGPRPNGDEFKSLIGGEICSSALHLSAGDSTDIRQSRWSDGTSNQQSEWVGALQ